VLNKQEMEEKYDKYKDCVFRTAFAYFKNIADAEDITSEVFIKYFTSGKNFEDEQHEKGWLMRITINRCKDILKSCRIKKTIPLEEACNVAVNQEENTVYSAVMTLPKKDRLVIHLYYYEGYTAKEIAELWGKSPQSVRTRLTRARKKLKKILGEEQTYEHERLQTDA